MATGTQVIGVYMAYDSAHHLFYSSNFNGGLWRIVID